MAQEEFAPEESTTGRLWFPVWPMGQSRVTGSGLIVPGPGTEYSTILLQWEGLPPRSEHALSQHHGESCSLLDERPEFVFSPVVSDSQGKAAVTVTPRKPFWRWWNRPHFLVLNWGHGVVLDAMACGEIVPPLELRPDGAPPLEAAVTHPAPSRFDLSRAQGSVPRAQPVPRPALTARECEVLQLVASGCTNAEIADLLVISLNTVERHITNLYTKINARNRAGATAYALRNGMALSPSMRS